MLARPSLPMFFALSRSLLCVAQSGFVGEGPSTRWRPVAATMAVGFDVLLWLKVESVLPERMQGGVSIWATNGEGLILTN